MFAYTNFHAWADGNKRTALMTTAFFFHLNQYGFDITEDSADFALEVAKRWIANPNAQPIEEIGKIVNWLRPRVSYPGLLRGPGRFLVTHTALDEEGWDIALKPWIDKTSKRIELVGLMHPTKVNSNSGQTKT